MDSSLGLASISVDAMVRCRLAGHVDLSVRIVSVLAGLSFRFVVFFRCWPLWDTFLLHCTTRLRRLTVQFPV